MAIDQDGTDGLRDRLQRQSEEALGKIAQDLLENPMVTGALSKAFEARERAVQAQSAAMGALNLPSADDIERLTKRVRSVSQRLEGIEDGLDRLEERLATGGVAKLESQLGAIEQTLVSIGSKVKTVGGRATGAKPAAATTARPAASKVKAKPAAKAKARPAASAKSKPAPKARAKPAAAKAKARPAATAKSKPAAKAKPKTSAAATPKTRAAAKPAAKRTK